MQKVAVTTDEGWLPWLSWIFDNQWLCVERHNLAYILHVGNHIHEGLPQGEDGVSLVGAKVSVLQPGIEPPDCRQEPPGHAGGVDGDSRQDLQLVFVLGPIPEV